MCLYAHNCTTIDPLYEVAILHSQTFDTALSIACTFDPVPCSNFHSFIDINMELILSDWAGKNKAVSFPDTRGKWVWCDLKNCCNLSDYVRLHNRLVTITLIHWDTPILVCYKYVLLIQVFSKLCIASMFLPHNYVIALDYHSVLNPLWSVVARSH